MSNTLTDKINISLLNAGMVAEQLVRYDNNGDETATLSQRFSLQKQGVPVIEIGEDSYTNRQIYDYLKEIEKDSQYADLPLCKMVSLTDIQEGLRAIGEKPWSKLSQDDKEGILWDLGLAVKRAPIVMVDGKDADSSRYFTRKGRHINMHGKEVYGIVISATERTDVEWLNSGYASDDAKLFTKDNELARDLAEIGRR